MTCSRAIQLHQATMLNSIPGAWLQLICMLALKWSQSKHTHNISFTPTAVGPRGFSTAHLSVLHILGFKQWKHELFARDIHNYFQLTNHLEDFHAVTNKGESAPSPHGTALSTFVLLDSTALKRGGTKLKLIKAGTEECLVISLLRLQEAARRSSLLVWGSENGSDHLSPARAEGLVWGPTLRASVTANEDEAVKRKRLRHTDMPAVSWWLF